MTPEKETRLSLVFLAIGYISNLVLGAVGSFFPPESFWQMTCWQLSDSLAIMASILASRWAGSKGYNLAAAGYTLLAITFGVSFASSSITSVNEEKMATILLPLVPAIILISYCKIFPAWLRFGSFLICIPFFLIYRSVINDTYQFENISNTLAYTGIQLLGALWTYFIWRDYRRGLASKK